MTVVLRDVMRTGIRALDHSSPLILERCGNPASGWPGTRKGAMSRALVPVSVGFHTIETGAARLAQCQTPWAFASIHRRCKSPKIRLYGGTSGTMSPPASDHYFSPHKGLPIVFLVIVISSNFTYWPSSSQLWQKN